MFSKGRGKTVLAMVLSVMMVASLMAGCGGEKAAGKVKDTVTVGTGYDAKTLDPIATNDVASSNVMNQIYGTLVQVNDKGEVVPMLAESYTKLDDKTYEFKLRKGVTFHNGEEMKASDVKFTLERAASPLGAAVAHLFEPLDVSALKVVDDYTIQIKLKYVFPPFISTSLTHTGGSILNEKAVKAAGKDYGQNPVGTGPFKFEKWVKGDRIELSRFDGYYGNKPAFKTLVIRPIPEVTNRVIELESGGIDVCYEVSANDLPRLQDNKEVKVVRVLDNGTAFMGMNTTKKPFDDVRVRQAISYAIDTPTVVNTVWRGIGKPAVSPVPPNIKYHNPALKTHEYNIEKAKQLLAEAGYPNGFKTSIWTNDRKERIDMATIMQNQLSQVGISAEIKVVEWGAYLEGTARGDQDMYIIGWTASGNDPDVSLFAMFHSSKHGAGGNRAFYSNPKVDALLEQGRQMEDSDARQKLYYDVQDMIIADAPWVFLNNSEQVVAVRKNITGFQPSPVGYHTLYNIKFEGQ
ncbi:Glutathione-binding protein GsiB [Sporomusa rhizae]|uniref:glutathione ABC transporter substrate-binding protein n=1 Tax=Sporomusa rhizae TaxID=357999 RepID=UPI00352BCA2E